MRSKRFGLAAVAAVAVAAPLGVALPASASPLGNVPIPGAGGDAPQVKVSPSTVTENDSGNVAFTVAGSNFDPGQQVTIHSSGLDAACKAGDSLKDQTATADYNGNFGVPATGEKCSAGTYRIDVSEKSTPNKTYTGTLHVNAPHGNSSSHGDNSENGNGDGVLGLGFLGL